MVSMSESCELWLDRSRLGCSVGVVDDDEVNGCGNWLKTFDEARLSCWMFYIVCWLVWKYVVGGRDKFIRVLTLGIE
jgi:hypothetical protein